MAKGGLDTTEIQLSFSKFLYYRPLFLQCLACFTFERVAENILDFLVCEVSHIWSPIYDRYIRLGCHKLIIFTDMREFLFWHLSREWFFCAPNSRLRLEHLLVTWYKYPPFALNQQRNLHQTFCLACFPQKCEVHGLQNVQQIGLKIGKIIYYQSATAKTAANFRKSTQNVSDLWLSKQDRHSFRVEKIAK